MNKEIQEAFGQVRAEDALKRNTQDYIYQKTNGYRRKKPARFRRLVPAFACLALLLVVGNWLYFTPTVAISIDINPSLELGVNRFNRVVSVAGYNDDGQALKDSLDIKYMNYTQAVNEIMESDTVASLLSEDEILVITVVGADSAQSKEILLNLETCTEGKENASCYYAHSEEVEMAHEAGLSCGKYKAFLELQALDPDITIEEVQNMTMREIRDRIDSLCTEEEQETNDGNNCGQQGEDHGHHGEKHREE